LICNHAKGRAGQRWPALFRFVATGRSFAIVHVTTTLGGRGVAKGIFRVNDNRVGFAELFFDLVFVFAITQISHFLLYHYDLKGAVQAGILFQAIWMVWIYTTWVLNQIDPDRGAVRALLFALMLGGLFVSMALPRAFDDRGMVFAAAFVAMQVGRTAFFWVATQRSGASGLGYTRIFLWFLLSAVFWFWGGMADPDMRLWLWLIAIGVEFVAALVGFAVPGLGHAVSTDWGVNGGHIAERCGLFVIICLGESLLVSGATFADMEWAVPSTLAFLASFATTIGMWWVYFHIGHKRGTHQIEHSDDPGRLARMVYSYIHIPIVAGVVLSAVGAERAIAHPADPATLAESASVIGGLILFLLGNGLFKWASAPYFPLSHLVGLGLCLVAIVVGPWTSLLVLNLAAATILALVAVWENRSLVAAKLA
jgi:low temperature requirement protein LtrA